MKGLESVKAFLCSKNEDTLSSAKDSLPSSEVDRDALIQALLEVRVELATLRASDQTSASTSGVTERSKPRALTSTAAQSELKATAAEFVQAAQNVASSEKSEPISASMSSSPSASLSGSRRSSAGAWRC